MIKLDQEGRRFAKLTPRPQGDLMRRHKVKDFIFNSPDVFFAELGQRLFLIGKDVQPARMSTARMDLLAVDEQGHAVVIVLSDGPDPSLLARAITCAGFVSEWKPKDFLGLLTAEQTERLKAFLEVSPSQINREQRAILISEFFDFEVLAATKWLWERNQMDHTCVRIFACTDPQTSAEYLGCMDLTDSMVSEVVLNTARPALLRQAESTQEPPDDAADKAASGSAPASEAQVVAR